MSPQCSFDDLLLFSTNFPFVFNLPLMLNRFINFSSSILSSHLFCVWMIISTLCANLIIMFINSKLPVLSVLKSLLVLQISSMQPFGSFSIHLLHTSFSDMFSPMEALTHGACTKPALSPNPSSGKGKSWPSF